MTWHNDYPEIAQGVEQAAQRLSVKFSTGKVFKNRTPEEAAAEHKEKMAKFKQTHPDIYAGLPTSRHEDIDWGALITPKSPFGE